MPESANISPAQFQTILSISRILTVTTDLDTLLLRIAEAATTVLAAERASIFLHDPQTDELYTRIAIGSREIRFNKSLGIAGHVFTQNALLHVPAPYDDPRFNPEPDRKTGFVTRNLLTAPMHDLHGQPIGVMQAVNKIEAHFSPTDFAIFQLLCDQAGVAIQRHRLQQAATEQEALRREMDLARKVQEQLIPSVFPKIPNVEAVGWAKPASITGGDGFDLWRMHDGRLGIFLADASGHGLAPAMVVSQARTLVRALIELDPNPHSLLGRVNARLADDLEGGRFVTAFLGFLSSQGHLEWSSAGQGPILFRKNHHAKIEELPPCALPLGVLPDWTEDPAPPIQLESTGQIFAISDGIFEAQSPGGELFGLDRVCEVLDQSKNQSLLSTVQNLKKSIHQWQTREEAIDDQTIVIAKMVPQ